MNRKILTSIAALLGSLYPLVNTASAQGTAFTYQGRLNDGANHATGNYDLTFAVFTDSNAVNQVGGSLTNTSVGITNGLFTVGLDFGPGIFNGSPLWLQIGVETNGGGGFTLLSPLQPLTPAPYAIYSPSAGSAASANGVAAGSVTGAGIAGSSVVKSLNNLQDAVTLSAGANVTITPSGNTLTISGTGGGGGGGNWSLTGNSGTTPGVNFLGTIDNQALEIHVNGTRAFRLEPGGGFPNVVGGSGSSADPNVIAATIAGGLGNSVTGFYGTIGGGKTNTAVDDATVAGGVLNTARGSAPTIGGGNDNLAGGVAAFVGGGVINHATAPYTTVGGGAQNSATLDYAGIGGGFGNQATAYGSYVGGGGFDGGLYGGNTAAGQVSTVGGGLANYSGGYASTVGGGYGNQATAAGAFVGGGGYDGFVSDGNSASGEVSTVAGGIANVSGGYATTISGGGGNYNVGDYSAIGGGHANNNAAQDAAIGGGYGNTNTGDYATVGGGTGNQVTAVYATIGGGAANSNAGAYGTIAGGNACSNYLNAYFGTIGGGLDNINNGYGGTICGGVSNQATASYATVAGGGLNTASGMYAFVAGQNGTASDNNSFLWSDGTRAAVSQGADSFAALATGGVYFYTDRNSNAHAELLPGGTSWVAVSDRNAKKNFHAVDTKAVLDKLSAIPIQQWNYKWEKDGDVPNIGPMAQDFKAAFFPGRDDKGISTLEFDGVELAAIQGLNLKLQEEARAQSAEIEQLKQSVAELKAMVSQLAQTTGK